MPKTPFVWKAELGGAPDSAFSAQLGSVTYYAVTRSYGHPAYSEVRGARRGLKRLDLGTYVKLEQAKQACERHYRAGCDLSKAETRLPALHISARAKGGLREKRDPDSPLLGLQAVQGRGATQGHGRLPDCLQPFVPARGRDPRPEQGHLPRMQGTSEGEERARADRALTKTYSFTGKA